jgi:heavy metal sensor kinase
MRSIRWSLILYFLVLVAAALGGVAYLCFQSTHDALQAKEVSTGKLWEKMFEDNRRRVAEEFDEQLVAQVRMLAQKTYWYHDRPEMLSVGLGVLASQAHNGGPLSAMTMFAEATFPNNAVRLHQPPPRPNILVEPPHSETPVVLEGQFYQTYMPRGTQLVPLEYSKTLGGFVWKLERETRIKADTGQMVREEVKLPSGQNVRRVTWRINVNYSKRGLVVEPPTKSGKSINYPGPPLPLPGEERSNRGKSPWIYLQYGVETSKREADIANLREQLASDLAELRGGRDETLLQLGTQFLWIGLATFAALVAGGFWLVRLGLSPLNRLSDAVSKVSEKDFRLPIDQTKLPQELKPIAGRLAETLDQLKRVFDREKQAAADISHELRTPVAALLTTLDITLRKPRSAEEYREVLEDCRNSGQQINQIVERLLTLARLDAGADQLRPRDIDVAALASQCVALVRPLAEARGLQLRLHQKGPAALYADGDKLREVLTNLLHNAIEYNKPNGTIEVEIERNNGTLAMEVRDTGIGISPEARQRIFERFFRADASRHADDTPHAGLGLAIVKGYIDLMGGSIDVDSTPGTGTTFRVRLPVR